MIKSLEFIEGYEACKRGTSRPRNPYSRAMFIEPTKGLKKFEDWHNGWNKCFYGEDINSEDPQNVE